MRDCAPRSLTVVALGVATLLARDAAAYEFELRARTVGQASDLLGVRFSTSDLVLSRRRFTQSLALDVWDLGRRRQRARPYQPDRGRGPRLTFSSYLRLDHDFGDFTSGQLFHRNRDLDALDLVPELDSQSLALDVLYAYAAADGLFDGRLDLRAGRQLIFDRFDALAFDGVLARADDRRLPLALELVAGLRVRDSSPLGADRFELDGTSAGECQEYVEGATPGSGAWRPIDVRPGDNDRFDNELDRCPQREVRMPVVAAALETARLPVQARLAYRRAVSPTPGLIGPADRFEYPDVGYYPDEHGQAPAWGVNEEQVTATVQAPATLGVVRGAAYAAARYSLLHGLIDQLHGGARIALGGHAIEPEVYYAVPTFDGDSIFNVFSTQPYLDARATWTLAPRGRALSGYLRPWARRFRAEDLADAPTPPDRVRWAGGGQAGLRWRAARTRARLDLFHEGGHGGRRTGGFASGTLPLGRALELGARASLIAVAAASSHDLTTVGLAASATWLVNRGIAFSLMIEDHASRATPSRLGAFAVLDLAFRPEL